jgi:hypothetical protein
MIPDPIRLTARGQPGSRASYHVIDSRRFIRVRARVSTLVVRCVQSAGVFHCAEGSSRPTDGEREKCLYDLRGEIAENRKLQGDLH